MKALEIPNLPDDVYREIEKQAHQRDQSIATIAAEILTKAVNRGEAETNLEDEIRAERAAMKARGFSTTPEEIQAFKVAGRK